MAEPKKAKKLEAVQGGLNFVKRMMRDADEPASKLDEVLKAKQAPMTTPSGTGLPLMPRDQGMYTPREQKELPRMPKVDAARAANKQPKYTERMQDLLDSPTARKKVDKLINQGKDLNMTEWYGTEPLRQVAMDAGRTPEQFESLMAQLASASQRNPVDKQNQMGSYLYHLSETGQLPENSLLLTNKLKKALKEDPSLAEGRTLVELPTGYGSLAQGDIFNRAVMIGQGDIAGALPPNKKLGTFYENLLGNLQPVTVDVNAVRGPIIERGDPRWLTSKLVEKDEAGNVINSYKPREMFESGEMTMREAKQRPGFWEAAPSGSEYAGFEDLWQRGAKRHGVKPAEAQALGWYGSADVTALKTKPENYVDNLERLIKRTAEQTGQSPKKVMNDLVTGEGFLRKKGGAVNSKDVSLEDRLTNAISKHMAGGGSVNGGSLEDRLTQAISKHNGMAQGGGAFKKIAFMDKGGKVGRVANIAKSVSQFGKNLLAERDVLPVESQAAKQARLNMMPTARIGLEAPGILIPSKMNNVREAVRNIKGNYGARRVERAADEIPNLERMYQEDALKQAFTGDNAAAMMTIDPSRFEEFATPISSTFTRPNSVRHTSAGDRVTFPEYLDYLKNLEGFDDVPFLEINKQLQGTMAKPYISGHEGRHRNRAMSQSGEKAGLVQLLPRSELREPFPRRTQEEYIEALKKELEMTGNIVLPQINKNQPNLPQRPAIDLPDIYAEGGSVFKTLQFKEPQHFDGGGIASPEEVNPFEGASRDPILSKREWENIKRNAPKDIANAAQKAKQHLKDEASQLGTLGGVKDLALRTGASYLGGIPDLVNLGLSGIDAVTDTNLSSDKPYFGSQQYLDLMNKAGMLGENEFPVAEFAASFLSPASLIKKGKKAYDKFSSPKISPQLAPAINTLDAKPLALPPPSVKLQVPPEAKTASTGKPQGATYATKQEGPFYRVSPTSLDVSGAKNRGIREAPELQSKGLDPRTTGQTGREVPQLLSSEEVGRIIADPAANQPLQIAQRFTKETQGTDFARPDIPESSLAKQSAIGRAQQLAVEGSPEYKTAVFDAYAKQMPDLLEQVGAKNYDDLMEKAYRQMAKETDEQFKALPYNFSYHRAGEGNYNGAMDMASDVHGNKHLYVYQGGDPHDFLNRIDKASGLNENEKFRAVHDLLGHAIYGNQFGPRGEEMAWAVHQQMYSPLARLAMTAETRGQNSMVNYTPLNVKVKSAIAKLDELEVQALRKGDKALVDEIRAAKRQEYAGFEFAPNKAVLLPPEFVDPKFTGGMPDYLSAANRPAKGTETQSVLTHFSNDPNLQFLDPTRYGTGIKGAEAERLREYAGGVKDRSYVYLGEPGTVSPESGLGVNRYRGESQNLYDITKDPLSFRALARESNRTPFTAKYNAGITHPLQEANDYERLVKEYGYEGMINPNASKPMGIMFKPTPVQPRKRGGLTQLKAR